jgi:hypothetical protein
MPCPDDPDRPPESHQCDSFAWASRLRTRWPPASLPPFRGCTRPQGGAVSLTAYMVPCVRFRPFVRFVSRLPSYGSATLGTGGWLDLTRQGLAPCKKRQACLGAHAAEGERAGTALFAVSVRSTAGVGRPTDTLRYLYAAFPLQRLLRFYPECLDKTKGWVSSPAEGLSMETPNWLGLTPPPV